MSQWLTLQMVQTTVNVPQYASLSIEAKDGYYLKDVTKQIKMEH